MKRIENFVFNDIVLYSKHWYKHSEDICGDLAYLFSKIYAWTPKTEEEVAHFMLRAIDKLYELKEIKFDTECCGRFNNSFASFYDEIKNRMRLYNVSFNMAIIYWGMSVFFNLTREEIKLIPPHYGKKEHFRLGRLFKDYPISQTYTEMNRIAERFYKDK